MFIINLLNIFYQESFQWREEDELLSLPKGLNLISNISRININVDSIKSIPEVLKNFEIKSLNWIGFIPKVSMDQFVYFYSGKLFDVATCGCNDELWQYGSYIILPATSLDDDKIKMALNMQMQLGDSIMEGLLNHFNCVIISGNDGCSFDIIWRKDWVYSEALVKAYDKINKI